jgi:hypothetical protein
VAFLPPWHRRDAPDGGDLGRWISAVYEVVVEGVARAVSLARPHYGLVGVGESGVQGVRRGIWFSPGNLVRQPLRVQNTLL